MHSFPFPVVPEKVLVNKRLAQCLNPNLPAGVHQKALEVYDLVFSKIQKEGLLSDLGMYTSGIFPLFEHAATMVKTAILNLLEKHFLELESLPCLSSVLLSILPGLEDETAEHFGRVFELVTKLKSLYPKEFIAIFWGLMAGTSKHRVAMINFLARDLPSGPHSRADLMAICGHDTNLVSKAMTAALQDRNPLVPRGVMDILVTHFPLNQGYLPDDDLLPIVKEALLLLLRRDMSLTRRYYSWVAPSIMLSPMLFFTFR